MAFVGVVRRAFDKLLLNVGKINVWRSNTGVGTIQQQFLQNTIVGKYYSHLNIGHI